MDFTQWAMRAILAFWVVWIGTGTTAQVNGFDANQPCGQIIRGASDMDKHLMAAWAAGYLAAGQGAVTPVDFENNKAMYSNLIKLCAQDETQPLVEIVGASDPIGGPGSRSEAEAMLARFLQVSADRVAMTAALMPTPEDINAVYGPPLAAQLEEIYAAMFVPGVQIGPRPGQNAVLVVHTSTGALQRGEAVLREFPGGYEEVRSYFISDVPIVRFKFVTEGKTRGLAFDGLVYVHDRWVLMPKPWRALE